MVLDLRFITKPKTGEEIIKEFGGVAYSPDFGIWADLEYEDNGKEYKRTTMVIGNPQWSGALDLAILARGEYTWNWAYDPENDMYYLLVKWNNGLRLPIAFDKNGAGKMLNDPYAKQKFDIMIIDKSTMPKNWDSGDLKFVVLWDIEFKPHKNKKIIKI
ncbi:hypothetical protein M1N06_03530 [Peptococcaceae bacterium]|nr:hypothetical protein [Peptococcaceae bacterium]